jgi:hypothetical protein
MATYHILYQQVARQVAPFGSFGQKTPGCNVDQSIFILLIFLIQLVIGVDWGSQRFITVQVFF